MLYGAAQTDVKISRKREKHRAAGFRWISTVARGRIVDNSAKMFIKKLKRR